MASNYLKLVFKRLGSSRSTSVINIIGLSTGLATCILIMLYILDENNYDKHHKDGASIFRIASVTGKGESWAAAPAPMSWTLKNEIPEVQQATRLLTFPDIENMRISLEDRGTTRSFFEKNGYYVDSTFFQVFTYDFLYGNAATALNEPSSIVLSESLSHTFFENINPVGKSLILNTPFGEKNYTVTGVFKTKNKSHIPANFLLSMKNTDMWNWVQQQTSWTGNNIFFTYVKLKTNSQSAIFEKKLNALFQQKAGADMKAGGFSKTLFIQPVSSIYLHSAIGNEIAPNGNVTYLYILGSIALFILMIACVNFMNLSTAQSQKRAREVGVRKVLGAQKSALIKQFLGESFLTCGIALVIAIGIARLLLPFFNQFSQKELHLFDNNLVLPGIIALSVLTALLSGIYPAFYLSAFKPVAVLKGKLMNNFSATGIRKTLVVFQFAVSIVLIVGAIVIWQQLNFLKSQHLGFKKEQQIILPLQLGFNNTESIYAELKNELVKNPAVTSVTSGSTYPGITNLNDLLFYAEGKTVSDVVDISLAAVGDDYIETLGISMLRGRSFTKQFTGDSASIILNETAVRQLGYDLDRVVGKSVQYDFQNNHLSMRVVGVVKDFHYQSLHTSIRPCAFITGMYANKYAYLIANFNARDYAGFLTALEKSWKKIVPLSPFVYSFLDQDFQRNYEKEYRTSAMVAYFTIVAIVIACLGLFGLAAFSAEQRTREIGIRKVLGASVASVTKMLSKDFLQLVFIALLVAAPAAWYFMNSWLQNFAYRIDVEWWVFVIAGMAAVLIALLTVSYQAIKAALANPVKSLKEQ